MRTGAIFVFYAMNEAGPNGESRREFLRGGARYVFLTALGVASVTLFRRSGGQLSGQTCINQGICSGCTAYTGCGLPQALSSKEFKSRSRRREEAQTALERKQSLLTSAATDEKGLHET